MQAPAAVEALARGLSAGLAPQGIRVVGLRPQASPETSRIKDSFELYAKASDLTWEPFRKSLARRTHPRRLPTLAELGEHGGLPGSDRASGMTGTIANLSMGSLDDWRLLGEPMVPRRDSARPKDVALQKLRIGTFFPVKTETRTRLTGWLEEGSMAYDERLADRIRTTLRGRDDVVEKRMFGGIAFMVAGRMACGVVHDDLMVRVGPDGHETALAQPHTRPMDFTGRPMRGMVYIHPEGIANDADLARWLDRAVSVATSAGSGRPT